MDTTGNTNADGERLSNNPPSDIDILREVLSEETEAMRVRRDELLASVSRAPSTIESAEINGRVGDLVKLLMALHKNAEAKRTDRKEVFLESGRAVDAAFKLITEPLTAAKQSLEKRMTVFQRAEADRVRREREEEARKLREEEDRKRREAEAAAAAIKTEADLDNAVAAEDAAAQASADVKQAEKAAEAKPADLSRTRGELGSVASLRTTWKGELRDRDTLDLEALRQHLPIDGLERAINAFVKAGGRELKGADIYELQTTAVR